MTDSIRRAIRNMRPAGATYAQIAAAVGLPVNTIKSYCRRNSILTADKAGECKQCGQPLDPLGKAKMFCCDKCRYIWWNEHRGLLNKQAVKEFTCAHCAKSFTDYATKARRYCGHACFIEARYGKRCAV